LSGPHDAGHYNSSSWETGFFVSQGGSWSTPYGHFFLSWYSGLLWKHAERVLTQASDILNRTGRPRVFKALKEVSMLLVSGTCIETECTNHRWAIWAADFQNLVSNIRFDAPFSFRQRMAMSFMSLSLPASLASSLQGFTGGSNQEDTQQKTPLGITTRGIGTGECCLLRANGAHQVRGSDISISL